MGPSPSSATSPSPATNSRNRTSGQRNRLVIIGMIFALVAVLSYGSIITKVGLFGSADFVPSAQRAAPQPLPAR